MSEDLVSVTLILMAVFAAWLGLGVLAVRLQKVFDSWDPDCPPECRLVADPVSAVIWAAFGFSFVLVYWPAKLVGWWLHFLLPVERKTFHQWFAGP